MISPQLFFVRWVEFSLVGALLLVAAKIAVASLRQPADRINLILMTFVMTAVAPLLMIFTPVPHWQLGFVASEQPMASETSLTAPRSDALPETLPVSLLIDPRRVDASPAVATLPVATPVAFRESGTASGTPALSASATEAKQITGPRNFDPWWFAAFGLIVTYGLAITYFIIESIIGTRRLTQLANRALPASKRLSLAWEEITDGRANQVRLLISSEITSPMAYGILQPTIMIPESIATGDPAILRFCLKHEWTHIENGDLRAWGMTWVCQFLIWFQPLFWMLRRDLRVCQDFLADHRAAGDGPARIEYSALLMAFTKLRIAPPIPGAIAFFDRSSHLSRRIHMLLNATLTLRPRSPRVFCVGAGIVLFTCAAFFGAIRLNTADGGAQAAQPASPAQESRPQAEKEKNPAEGSNVAVKIIRGSVADQAGRPVAKAKLCLPLSTIPRKVVQATADDSGQFEVKVPMELLQKNERETQKTLWALAPNYCVSTEDVGKVIDGEANELNVKFVLPPQEKLSFKILSPKGDPLHGALVQPRQYKTVVTFETIPEEFTPILGATTDAGGIATISAVHANRLMSIRISNEKFGHQILRVNGLSQEPTPVVRLRAPGRIEGRLIGDKARWICGTRISIFTADLANPMKIAGTAKVVTDDGGEFVVPAFAGDASVGFRVAIDPAFPVLPLVPHDLYLKKGGTMRIEIPLVPAPMVHGTIRSKSTGKPVPNAQVMLISRYTRDAPVKANDQGYFEARVLPGPVRPQLILSNNYAQLGSLMGPSQFVPEGVERFELTPIEVVELRELSGTLVDEKSKPMTGTRVQAIHQGREYAFGTTDSAGRFQMKVAEGVETTFEIHLEEAGSPPLTAMVVQKNPLILRNTGEQPGDPDRAKKADVTLTGRVLFEGKPVTGVILSVARVVSAPRMADKNDPSRSRQARISRFLQVAKTQSDADGRYRLSGLKADDQYQIAVKPTFPAADYTWNYQPPHSPTLDKQAKGDLPLPDLNLRKLSQSLAGTVVDSAGKPVNGVQVTPHLLDGLKPAPLFLTTGAYPWATTDSAGQFYLRQLPDEPLVLSARIRDVNGERGAPRSTWLEVEKNQQNIRIVLDP